MNYKVGDLVTDGYEIWRHKDNCRALKEVQDTWVKWEPKDGEWCIFWDITDTSYVVGKYTKNKQNDGIMDREWDNIAPLEFVQTLRDKK